MGCCASSKRKYKFSEQTILLEKFVFCKDDIRKSYKFGKVIGTGKTGNVRLCEKINPEGTSIKKESQGPQRQQQYSIKSILKMRVGGRQNEILKQLQVFFQNNHPNIAKFYGAYEDDVYLYFVMEYCSGGELFLKIIAKGKISELDAAVIMSKLFLACAYLHSKGIAHRNIKPENIYLSQSGEVKLIGFWQCKKFDEVDFMNQLDLAQSVVGTPFFQAPELLRQCYGVECDNWSLGIILYLLLSGKLPYKSKDINKLDLNQIERAPQFKDPLWVGISQEAKELLCRLLDKNPSSRMTSQGALESSWMKKYLPNPSLKTINLKKTFQVDDVEDQTPPNDQTVALLKTYVNSKKMKKETLKIFVNLIKEEDLNKLKAKFIEIDIDHDGVISINDLLQMLRSLGYNDTESEIKTLIKKVHLSTTNSNQHFSQSIIPEDTSVPFINYEDFLAATLDQKQYLDKENLWAMFKHYDTSNRNFLQIEDLNKAFVKGGRTLTGLQLHQLFNEMDTDGDGNVDFKDFCRVMLQSTNEAQFEKKFEADFKSPNKPLLNEIPQFQKDANK